MMYSKLLCQPSKNRESGSKKSINILVQVGNVLLIRDTLLCMGFSLKSNSNSLTYTCDFKGNFVLSILKDFPLHFLQVSELEGLLF